jgi:hypothetical protein
MYQNMTNGQLISLLKRKNLSTEGEKGDLIKRLQDNTEFEKSPKFEGGEKEINLNSTSLINFKDLKNKDTEKSTNLKNKDTEKSTNLKEKDEGEKKFDFKGSLLNKVKKDNEEKNKLKVQTNEVEKSPKNEGGEKKFNFKESLLNKAKKENEEKKTKENTKIKVLLPFNSRLTITK